MKYIVTIILIFYSSIGVAKSVPDTLQLKSVEIYFFEFARDVEFHVPLAEMDLVNLVRNENEKNCKCIVIDTVLDLLKLYEIDSILQQNKYLKSEIKDSINRFIPKNRYSSDIRLVFIMNYSHKRIVIGLNDFVHVMTINKKEFRINKKLYNYFLSFLKQVKGQTVHNYLYFFDELKYALVQLI